MATAQQLGEYIIKANPYTKKKNPNDPHPTPMDPMLDGTEQDYYVVLWYFKNGSYRIGKALRIPYCFKNDEGQDVRDYILVGYEGAGP